MRTIKWKPTKIDAEQVYKHTFKKYDSENKLTKRIIFYRNEKEDIEGSFSLRQLAGKAYTITLYRNEKIYAEVIGIANGNKDSFQVVQHSDDGTKEQVIMTDKELREKYHEIVLY